MAPDPARLFLALWPDAATRQALQAWQGAIAWPADARPTAPAHLHLTLHFMGAVPRARLPALQAGLGRPFTPFTLQLAELALWRGGLAVLLPAQAPPELAALHAGLAVALRSLALPVDERPFRPHVTLARHAAGAMLTAPVAPLAWRADTGYVLAESAGGYHVLHAFGAATSRPSS
ncbi:MAG: RNA 2',3'-cyclic phosphodiesterase [Pseudomonadota bacterium]